MQLIIILLSVAILTMWTRDGGEGRKSRDRFDESGEDQAQIDQLKSRVSTLEEILLDRDRQFRDGFRGL